MKLDEILGEDWGFLFLFEHSTNCNFRIEQTPTEIAGYYIVDDVEFVASIQLGHTNIDNTNINFANFMFGVITEAGISYTLQNNPNVNEHRVLGCANAFLHDNLSNLHDIDLIVFAATRNNHIPSKKYPTPAHEIDARMRVYNLMAQNIAIAGSLGVLAKNIPTVNGKVTLIRTKNIEHINTQTILQYLTKLGKI